MNEVTVELGAKYRHQGKYGDDRCVSLMRAIVDGGRQQRADAADGVFRTTMYQLIMSIN